MANVYANNYFWGLIMIRMTSENRADLINLACNITNAKSYLEIGCNLNEVFDYINCPHKVGVDPARGGTLRMTSDEYFAQYDEKFDVIFIDGLHYYEQVKKDFENSIKVLNNNGMIIFHDMLPLDPKWAVVPVPENLETYGCWTGDVWRMAFDLIAMNDIKFRLVMIDNGCGVVTKGKQESIKLDRKDEWNWYAENIKHLPLISYQDFTNTFRLF